VTDKSQPRVRRRPTVHQQAVVEILQNGSHFRSAQELYVELRVQRLTRVGLTTVNRILQALTAQNITEAPRAEDGETLYRRPVGYTKSRRSTRPT
jgi:Fe2+ or Zn2+ uptake regulation protein